MFRDAVARRGGGIANIYDAVIVLNEGNHSTRAPDMLTACARMPAGAEGKVFWPEFPEPIFAGP